jgi:hypothetical protein
MICNLQNIFKKEKKNSLIGNRLRVELDVAQPASPRARGLRGPACQHHDPADSQVRIT